MDNAFPIDVVIPWVDGEDPVLKARREQWLSPGAERFDDVAGATRYRSVGEIEWCVASIRRFMPWTRHIFIVTDGQTPMLRHTSPDEVTIIDHTTLFKGYESYLPVFNSRAIDTMIARIPGLSEHFIYFNDDFMLLRPVTPEMFFDGDTVIYHAGTFGLTAARILHAIKPCRMGHKPVGFKDSMVNAADIMGCHGRFVYLTHAPRPMHRSFFETYFAAHPDVLIRNIRHRFRDADQYSVHELFYLDALRQGRCRLESPKGKVLYLKPRGGPHYVSRKLQRFDATPEAWCCCFNSLDQATPSDQALITRWLDTKVFKE